MLKLLTCLQGHYWEKPVEDGADGQAEVCPVCGQSAEMMPLLDPASSEAAPPPAEPPTPPPLRDKDDRPIVAGYEILQDLGKGPTGVYRYRARQLLVNRLVTLKVVFAGDDPGQFAWGSLRNEAGALGRMAHPNIVQVLEAGERDRQLFYNAVEHVDGPTLAEALDGKPLPIRQAAALVETLARAMHHAHEKNILHRNLKPTSILLQPKTEDGERKAEEKTTDAPSSALRLPSSDFLPKITDFGLARRPVEGDASDVELQGERPNYLAPEQVWGRAKEIGPATDVYALGAIFYELLTSQPPFRADSAAETLDAIQCREAPSPSRLRRLPRDLDIICRKCLAKKPRRRYASALELADDLRRWADGYPIKARTAGAAERFGKWFRRNVRTVALVLLGLWAAVSLVALLANKDDPDPSRPSRQAAYWNPTAQLQRELLQVRRRQTDADYLNSLLLAERALVSGERDRANDLLNRCPMESRHWEWHFLHGHSQGLNSIARFETSMPVAAVGFSSDGRYLAAGGGDADSLPGAKGEVSVWDLVTGQRVRHWRTAMPVRGVAFNRDNNRLAVAGSDGPKGNGEIHIYAIQPGRLLASRRYPGHYLNSVAFIPNSSKLLIAGGDGSVFSVSVDLLDPLLDMLPRQVHFEHPWRVGERRARLLPLSPDPERFAAVSPDGGQVAIVEDLRQGDSHNLRGPDTTILALAYDAHHGSLATAGRDRAVRLWQTSYPYQSTGALHGHRGAVTGVSYSSDGERLASCGDDGTVRIWAPEHKVELLTQRGFHGASGVLFGRGKAKVDRLAIVHGNKVTLIEPR
ncbi:MAG TPA: serine/threonine-protein kinase [Gemmataceae bacterium]